MATLFRFILFCFLLILASSVIGQDSISTNNKIEIKKIDFDCLVQKIDTILKGVHSDKVTLNLHNLSSRFCRKTKDIDSLVNYDISKDPGSEEAKSFVQNKLTTLTRSQLECIKLKHAVISAGATEDSDLIELISDKCS